MVLWLFSLQLLQVFLSDDRIIITWSAGTGKRRLACPILCNPLHSVCLSATLRCRSIAGVEYAHFVSPINGHIQRSSHDAQMATAQMFPVWEKIISTIIVDRAVSPGNALDSTARRLCWFWRLQSIALRSGGFSALKVV